MLWLLFEKDDSQIVSPISHIRQIEKKEEVDDKSCLLIDYGFDRLRERYQRGEFGEVEWEVGGKIKEVELRRNNLGYKSQDFAFKTARFRYKSGQKWISGMMNYFDDGQKRPLIIMIRGYAEQKGYYSGFGSWKVADELAKNGWSTVSLDFLGFGGSDDESQDIMESRFEKVPSVLDLIAVVNSWEWVDRDKIGIWAHSSGGQIAMSVLEVSALNYPTVLWAPMTNPFPKSLLDTASELDDSGKLVLSRLKELSENCDVKRYAIDSYYEWIKAPIKVIQGDEDVWCKTDWQEKMVKSLKEKGKKADLVIMTGADHNMSGRWYDAVDLTIGFFDGVM